LSDRVDPEHRGRHIRHQWPTIDHIGGRYRKRFVDLVRSSYREPRLRLEMIDCATQEFMDKTAHIVGRKNETSFLVD
jgi:hypothetical protein